MTMEEIKTRDGDSLAVFLTIEGVGDYSAEASEGAGQWAFSTAQPVPSASQGDEVWKLGYISSLPKEWTAVYDRLGGAPKVASGRTARLVLRDDLLAKMAFGSAPITALSGETSKVTTTWDYLGDPPTANTVVFVDREAVFVESVDTGAGTFVVTRSRLGTAPAAHSHGAQVFSVMPTIIGRKAKVFVVPVNLESGQRVQIGPDYLVKNWACPGLGAEIELELVSADRVFARKAPAVLRQVVMTDKLNSFEIVGQALPYIDGVLGFSDDQWRLFLSSSDEKAPTIFEVDSPRIQGRELVCPLAPTAIQSGRGELAVGDLLTQVFLANRDFRYHPDGTVTARNVTGWVPTSHAADYLLCVLTSSHDPRQDFIATNGSATYGNWACLPNGAGAGVPADDIDFPSFLAFRREFADYKLPSFVWGARRTSIAQLVDDLLRPMRAMLIWGYDETDRRCKIRLVVPRMPALSETVREVDASMIVGKWDRERRVTEPRLTIRNDPGASFARVVFVVPGATGADDYRITANDNTLGSREGSDEIAELSDAEVEVRLPYSRAESRNQTAQAQTLALRLLQSIRTGTEVIEAEATLALADATPGEYIELTIDGVPDVSSGDRGMVSRLAQIRRADVSLSPPRVDIEAVLYRDRDRLGLIAPSVEVASASDETTAWRITSPDANVFTIDDSQSGLPQDDTAAFRVGQAVRLLRANGEPRTGEGVVSARVSATVIDVTKGTMPEPDDDDVLVLVHWDADLPAPDRLIESYFADDSTLRLPDDTAPFVYGD